MAKAKRIKTRYPGIYRVGARYEWITRSDSDTVDTLDEARKANAKAEARVRSQRPCAERSASTRWTGSPATRGARRAASASRAEPQALPREPDALRDPVAQHRQVVDPTVVAKNARRTFGP
jgi:hypothetical protein